MKKGLTIAFCLLAAAAITLGVLTSGTPATVVKTAEVSVGDFEYTAEVSGEASAGELYTAMPAVSGRVARVYVAEGQRIRKGDKLFSFDETDTRNALKQAQYELDATLAAEELNKAELVEQEAVAVMAMAPEPESMVSARLAAAQANSFEQLAQDVIAQAQGPGVDLGVLNKAVEAMALFREAASDVLPLPDIPVGEQEALTDMMEPDDEAALAGMLPPPADASFIEDAALVGASDSQSLQEAMMERAETLAENAPASSEASPMSPEAASVNPVAAPASPDAAPVNPAAALESPEVALCREKVRQAEEALNRLTMTSAMDGEVLGVALREGEIAAAGSGAVVIGDTDRMLVTLRVPEYELKNVEVGQRVRLDSNGIAGTGKVVKRGAALMSGTYGEVFGSIEVEPDAGFAPLTGASVEAEIILDESSDTLYVPRECVVTEEDGRYVYACEDGKAKKKPVTTGLESDYFIELLSGAVAGEVLIIAPFDLMDGGAVTVEM